MLRRLANALATAALVAVTVVSTAPLAAQSAAEPTIEDLKKIIEQLRAELDSQTARNDALETQINELAAAIQGLESTSKDTDGFTEAQRAELDEAVRARPNGQEWITIKGFISATYFAQDQKFAFGNGQNAQWPVPPEHTDNEWFSGGDVRNSRLTLLFSGPELGKNLSTGGGLEMDFFAGFNGTGAFSHQQPEPRLRLAWADLKGRRTTLRIGQYWSPAFGEVPVSLSHIAFPLGFGSAGMVGWRFPGIFVYHKLSSPDSPVQAQLDFGLFEGSWNGPGSPVASLSAGNVGFNPQVEAKLNLSGKSPSGTTSWKLYGVVHWDEKDLRGPGNINPDVDPYTLTGSLYEIGGKLQAGRFLIHGNVYTSQAAGQQFTAITQFGDISDWGAWLQVGFDVSQSWSLFAFHGIADPDDDDVLEWVGPSGRVENEQSAFMIRWKRKQYQLGLEYLVDTVTTGASNNELTGNQIAFSAMYAF
jgi:cell division protein FtsB